MVIALAVLAGLIGIVASVVASQALALRAEGNRIDARRARVAAMAGVQRALAALETTVQAAGTPTTGTTTTVTQGQAQMQTDEWYTLGAKGAERFMVGNSSFRIEIADAAGFVNLNTAPEAQLNTMPLTTQQVAAILDWREATPTPRVEGAKDDYYNALSKPYNAKLRRFDSVDELLDVRYFTPNDLYAITENATGLSTQTISALPDGRQAVLADLVTTESFSDQKRPDGTAMINVGAAVQQNQLQPLFGTDAQRVAQGAPYNSLGDVFAQVGSNNYGNVLDYLTTNPANRVEGKINVNTATEAVLMTLPEMTTDLAQGIVNYQATGFTKLSDLLQVSGFTDAQNLRRFAGYFTVRSSVFLVRVVGESNGSQIALEAVVDVSSGTPRILKMHDQPYSDMPARWGWAAETENETVLVEAS